MDDTCLHEKNRLFPKLTVRLADNLSEKFGAFHLVDYPDSEIIRNGLSMGRDRETLSEGSGETQTRQARRSSFSSSA